MIKKAVILLAIALCIGSCASNKKVVYLSNGDFSQANTGSEYASVLQNDDNIVITVIADKPEIAAPFNLVYLVMQSIQVANAATNPALTSYLIDQNGEIDFPGIGKIKLAGLTRIEAQNKIKELLSGQIKNPGVILRVINYKVSVLGEVGRPGDFTVTGERITIFEALSKAGDLTIYGKRREIMVIREKDGVKTVDYVDITKPDVINSPYYYLHRNDVLYVKPNKTRVNSSVIGPNLTVGMSAISLLITIIAFSTR